MAYQLLNNISHQKTKINQGYCAAWGHQVSSVVTFITEFGDIHKEYPILFNRNSETKKYHAIALLGFEEHENLFLDDNVRHGWSAHYIPGVIAKGPFLIGYQDQSHDGGNEQTPVIHLDMADPRVNTEHGVDIFLSHGGNSEYITSISRILQGINKGITLSEEMFIAFEYFDLIEPLSIEIELPDEGTHVVQGSYTISQEKLAALDGKALAQLNKAGFLQAAFLVVSSLSNINHLIQKKSRVYKLLG
ncbi:MAG: SapC family protein [Thalassotalea sp.]